MWGSKLSVLSIPRSSGYWMSLRSYCGAGHCSDDFNGIRAHSGFRRKHYGVRTIEHRIRYIKHLSTRRHRVFNHGLHHLRGRDNHAIALSCSRDQVFLDTDELRVTHLNPKIAPCHHDPFTGIDDVVEQCAFSNDLCARSILAMIAALTFTSLSRSLASSISLTEATKETATKSGWIDSIFLMSALSLSVNAGAAIPPPSLFTPFSGAQLSAHDNRTANCSLGNTVDA